MEGISPKIVSYYGLDSWAIRVEYFEGISAI